MSGPESAVVERPRIFQPPSLKFGLIGVGTVAAAEVVYIVTNPFPAEYQVSSPAILNPKNKSPEAIAHKATVSKLEKPKATPVGDISAGEAGIGLAAVGVGVLLFNGARRGVWELRKHRADKKQKTSEQ